ncbi:MAG: hypothetical protein ACK5LL_09870 [Suipraeoptans sp.]
MKKIEKYLKSTFHKELYFTENGCKLMSQIQEMITAERIIIKKEINMLIPKCRLQLLNDESINAFTTIIEDAYCIFLNKGIIEEQKLYLQKSEWSFIFDTTQIPEYIDNLIEYGFYFIAFHEYAHIFCGHVDAGLNNSTDKKTQECEADMFAMDYLIKYILYHNEGGDYVTELEKLFLAVFFLFEKMQKQNKAEEYNGRMMQNYYDEDREIMRDHPLDIQRILYLFNMLNVIVISDDIQKLTIKGNVLDKLKVIKGWTDTDLPKRTKEYLIASESVEKLVRSKKNIREKIPRTGDIEVEGEELL